MIVARTIADLAGAEHIDSDHVSEAVQFRSLDRRTSPKEALITPGRFGASEKMLFLES
ncbi:MAG TPA: hypothetical protein VFC26_15680 [Verrucomicrobiae bacterium]|nr:hypothetical protein [Verrucomicrobiae bacterium]